MLGTVAFFTTAPMLATISVNRGFKVAIRELVVLIFTGGPLYFLFHIGTKWHYYGQTILAGGAKYRATGRGFVTKHTSFDELFRFYASSHLYAGFELAVGLILYGVYSISTQYFGMTWALWLVVASWTFSPIWFNPLAFEWSDVTGDVLTWFRWLKSDAGNANQSWRTWFSEENAYYKGLQPWAKGVIISKAILYMCVSLALITESDPYHSFLSPESWLPLAIIGGLIFLALALYSLVFQGNDIYETSTIRFLKFVYVVGVIFVTRMALEDVENMVAVVVAFAYMAAGIGLLGLITLGAESRIVQRLYLPMDWAIGGLMLLVSLLLAALYVPGKIQTWLLYNNALSKGVVIEDILRSNADNAQLTQSADNSKEVLTSKQMKSIILEQQKVIDALTTSSSSANLADVEEESVNAPTNRRHSVLQREGLIPHNVSDNDLAALSTASQKLSKLASEIDAGMVPRESESSEKPLGSSGSRDNSGRHSVMRVSRSNTTLG